TILYTGVSGNDLTGVTRGFQGAAKAWAQGTKVARLFTAYDYDALRQNVNNVSSSLDAHVSAIATQEQLGHVKAGQNITIDSDGTINAKGGNVDSVNGKTGEVVIDVEDIPGLVSSTLALG